MLRVYRMVPRCRVLGPGVRAVVWVQGCPFRCPECVAPETLAFEGGEWHDEAALGRDLAAIEGIEGLTLSGGEPMAQAEALVRLIDAALAVRPEWSIFCYTGFLLEDLQREGTGGQRALLARLDVLVDGPYIASRHTDLRWRGSDNQRVHFLTDRHRHLAHAAEERGTWIETRVTEEGHVDWMGIPPRGFRAWFEAALHARGVDVA